MSTTKKIIFIVFATLLLINMQFNTPITRGMENGFSLEQLADNIFVPEAYATSGGSGVLYGQPTMLLSGDMACCPVPDPTCDPRNGWAACE